MGLPCLAAPKRVSHDVVERHMLSTARIFWRREATIIDRTVSVSATACVPSELSVHVPAKLTTTTTTVSGLPDVE